MEKQKHIFTGKWQILWLSVALGILFWTIDSFVNVFIFHEGRLLSQIFTPGHYELYMRLHTMGLLIIFGSIAQYMVLKHKKAEETLRKSEDNLKLYQALINQSNDSVEVLDPETGYYLNINTKTCADLGYSREELLSMKIFDVDPLVKPSDFPKIMEDLRTTGGGIWNGIHQRKDGSTFPVEVSLKLVQLDRSYVVAVARDITARKRLEEQLFQIKQDWEDTFNIITDMITIHDKDFNIIHANKAAEKILGLPFLDVSPSKCYQFYHGTGCPPEGCPSCECLKTGLPSTSEIYEPYLKMFIEIRAIPRFDSNNNLSGLIHVVRDITGRKRLEDQLRQSQKMEAIGQLAGGIAHDFNNILTAVIGYSTILKMRMGSDDPLKVNLDQILAASEKGADLTQSLLAFSRQQISNPEPVNINEQIRSLENLLLRVIGEDIELKTAFTGVLTVMADRVQLDQVLINLCTNARDAMPDGGVLTIGTRLIELNSEFIAAHGYGKSGAYAVISVSDTGIGMDEKTRERIFDPFYTTKEVGKGTGLGLSIVYGIVKQHNGYITCDSDPGKGSTFRVYLPISKLTATETHSEEIPEFGGQTATILLAEDELSVRKLTRVCL
jgi:PAS domain S-box-containing protein